MSPEESGATHGSRGERFGGLGAGRRPCNLTVLLETHSLRRTRKCPSPLGAVGSLGLAAEPAPPRLGIASCWTSAPETQNMSARIPSLRNRVCAVCAQGGPRHFVDAPLPPPPRFLAGSEAVDAP